MYNLMSIKNNNGIPVRERALMCALFSDDIIGIEVYTPGDHCTMCIWGFVCPVGTDGRPPTHMGW